MKGTKRLTVSESAPDPNDSAFQNKRIMAGSLFDVHRAEQSQQQSMATPPLDKRRADSSRQHVRALNTQFARWVQAQLKNHPDELWEDGVRDYIAHASNIMETFSDVVDWLKANSLKETTFTPATTIMTTSFSTSGSFGLLSSSSVLGSSGLFSVNAASGSSGPFSNNAASGSSGLFFNNAALGNSGGFSNSSASWSSGVFSNSQTPAIEYGNQSTLRKINNASNVADDEDELPQPSSPSVKKSEEKGIIVVHEVKCKLYVKSSDPADKDAWKDKGTGNLSIKCKEGVSKGTKESKPTVLVRNDGSCCSMLYCIQESRQIYKRILLLQYSILRAMMLVLAIMVVL